MPRQSDRNKEEQTTGRTERYKGRRIILREKQDDSTLYIDNEPVKFGRLPSGHYYLEPYAYDTDVSLLEVVKRFIDYQERSREGQPAESKEERGHEL
jgi:hypothetical protein